MPPWSYLVVCIGSVLLALLASRAVRRALRLRRLRRPPRYVAEFLDALRHSLARRGVGLAGLVPGRFSAILVVDRQETPVPLHPLLHHWRNFRTEFDAVVARLIREIREDGLDRTTDFEFAELATDILPQVRTLDWLRANSPAFGDARIAHRRIGADLAVCYVIDDSWSMVFVCEGHLRRWGRTEQDLFGVARRNLAERTDRSTNAQIADGRPFLLRTADGYAAARLLLLDADRADDLLVALPDRDTLWIGDGTANDEGDRLADLMARNAEENAHSARPLSPKLYRLQAGRLAEVSAH